MSVVSPTPLTNSPASSKVGVSILSYPKASAARDAAPSTNLQYGWASGSRSVVPRGAWNVRLVMVPGAP